MASALGARGEQDPAQLRRIAAVASAVAVLSLTVVLMGWMLAQVAEHPGVPREMGELPRWFAGEPAMRSAREHAPAPVAAAHGPEAGVAIVSVKPGTTPAARAPEKADAAEGDYAEFAGGQIEIALLEYKMKPNKIRAKPGAVTFVLRNEGRFAHDFHVEGPRVEAYAAKFSPGRTVRLEVSLQEGEYKISCPLSNHDQRGMHGTLVVTSKLAGK
ncbi:MAG: cupredoxin domain-containing protein [Burkholderiales bacterium]|nr:cupredoxin domain-containing protein [Burkholderiales bacterium]